MFIISLTQVGVMLLYIIPGFLLMKTKKVKESCLSDLSIILMFVCQPCLTVYTFQKATFSTQVLMNLGILFLLVLALMLIMLVIFYFLFRKKYDDVRYRIGNLAVCFGNFTFMGVPLLEALFPDSPEMTVYSIMFFAVMSILGWTVGSVMITGDKKACKPLTALTNPAILSLFIALPLFFANIEIPEILMNAISLVGKMSTPICMLVLGMRLATVSLKSLLLTPMQYLIIAVKQFGMPILGFLVVWFLPLDINLKMTFVILCSCPVAAVVLNFAELLGGGQKTAANLVLLSTLTSVLTMPLIMLILQAIV